MSSSAGPVPDPTCPRLPRGRDKGTRVEGVGQSPEVGPRRPFRSSGGVRRAGGGRFGEGAAVGVGGGPGPGLTSGDWENVRGTGGLRRVERTHIQHKLPRHCYCDTPTKRRGAQWYPKGLEGGVGGREEDTGDEYRDRVVTSTRTVYLLVRRARSFVLLPGTTRVREP